MWRPKSNKLTSREAEVLRCAASDLGVQETAECLCIGRETAKTHRAHAMAKLGCVTMAGAVAMFVAGDVNGPAG